MSLKDDISIVAEEITKVFAELMTLKTHDLLGDEAEGIFKGRVIEILEKWQRCSW